MQKDIRLHGHLDNGIEYFVLVSGNDAYQRYFFNIVQEQENLRVFSPGNEVVLGPAGIRYEGNGGYFCEYMFGVEQPIGDLTKPEIVNRLVMYGAYVDEQSGALRFREQASGYERYEQLFVDGNGVCNYFFCVHSPRLSRRLPEQQQELVRLLGKILKRTASVGEERDDLLVSEMFPLLQDPSAQLFVIKLINTGHREYRDLFRSLYYRSKKIADSDFARLVELAARYRIDRYQQERIRIDVMYRHPANRRIVDEYRSILIVCAAKGEISPLDNARLNRLKVLSVRNKIPGALFHALDDLLKKRCRLRDEHEHADGLARTRQILEGFFLSQCQIDSAIDREDMLALLEAKKQAVAVRDQRFDQMMLDFSRTCDERIRDGADPELLQGFSYLTTCLDRLDDAMSLLGQLAFMENVRISREMIERLLECKVSFDGLRPDGFRTLCVDDLLENPYLGRYGRRKVTTLLHGLHEVRLDLSSVEQLLEQLLAIDREEHLYLLLLEQVRRRVRNFYASIDTNAEKQALRHEVTEELKAQKKLVGELPDQIFGDAVEAIQNEAIYLKNLLPLVIAESNRGLREDFLQNSGMDRFYLEELEREYCEDNGLDPGSMLK